jgi:hypothetical protein
LIGFDEFLIEVLDETMRYCLGDRNTEIVYQYLERNGLRKDEIPARLQEFSMELRNIMGTDRGQILGYARILEETILEALCIQMKIKFDNPNFNSFAESVKKLEKIYDVQNRNQGNLVNASLRPDFCSEKTEATAVGGEKR